MFGMGWFTFYMVWTFLVIVPIEVVLMAKGVIRKIKNIRLRRARVRANLLRLGVFWFTIGAAPEHCKFWIIFANTAVDLTLQFVFQWLDDDDNQKKLKRFMEMMNEPLLPVGLRPSPFLG